MADKPTLEDLSPFGKCVIDLYTYNSARQRLLENTSFKPEATRAQINEWLSQQMQAAPMLAYMTNQREYFLTMGDIRGIVATLDQRDPKTGARTYAGHEALDRCEDHYKPLGSLPNAAIRPDRLARF